MTEALSSGAAGCLEVIRSYMVNNKKKYCFPSRETIRGKLYKQLGIERSVRSIDYYNKELVDKGYIQRVRRNKIMTGKVPIYQSTLYKLTSKAMKYLYKRAHQIIFLAGEKFKSGFHKKKKEEKRKLKEQQIESKRWSYKPKIGEMLESLNKL